MLKKIKTILFFGCICLLCLQCDDSLEKKRYYKSGKLHSVMHYNEQGKLDGQWKDFYESGELMGTTSYKNGQPITTEAFYESGKIKRKINWTSMNDLFVADYNPDGTLVSKGRIYKANKTGWWEWYNNKGELLLKQEYLLINDNEYLNQSIAFSKNKIAKEKSDYFVIDFPKVLHVGKNKIDIDYIPLYGSKSTLNVCIGYGLKPDFSNISQIRIDTFTTGSHRTYFGVECKKPGKDTIRGFTYEYLLKMDKDHIALTTYQNKKYFEKVIEVNE
jgi:hypothetical protein